jgi:hypothetical protein
VRAVIISYLQALTIQIRQTRENNITVKNLAEEKPCKASLGYSSASRTLEVAIYAEYYKLSSRLYKISSINENQTTKYQKQ